MNHATPSCGKQQPPHRSVSLTHRSPTEPHPRVPTRPLTASRSTNRIRTVPGGDVTLVSSVAVAPFKLDSEAVSDPSIVISCDSIFCFAEKHTASTIVSACRVPSAYLATSSVPRRP